MGIEIYETTSFIPKGWSTERRPEPSEVPTDARLPQLRMAFDENLMARLIQDCFLDDNVNQNTDDRSDVIDCRIAFARNKLPRYCHVYYQVKVQCSRSHEIESRIVGTKILGSAFTDRDIARAVKRMKRNADPAHVPTFLPEHRMIVMIVPADLKVTGLPNLLDSKRLETVARRVFQSPEAVITQAQADGPLIEVMSYRPERYCLIRCGIQLSPASHPRTVFARAFHQNGAAADVDRIMEHLWRHDSRQMFSEPLGYDPETRILFQASLPGQVLTSLVHHRDFLNHIRSAARCLAVVHDSSVQSNETKTMADEAQQIATAAQELGQALPSERERLDQLVNAMLVWSMKWPDVMECQLHGDFSPNQILVDSDLLSIIDFNSAYRGDPLRDIASFLVRLSQNVEPTSHRLEEAFCDEYESQRPGNIDPERLLWHRTSVAFREAFAALKKLKPGWAVTATNHLSAAESIVSQAGSASAKRPLAKERA